MNSQVFVKSSKKGKFKQFNESKYGIETQQKRSHCISINSRKCDGLDVSSEHMYNMLSCEEEKSDKRYCYNSSGSDLTKLHLKDDRVKLDQNSYGNCSSDIYEQTSESLADSVHKYDENFDIFKHVYLEWKRERLKTIEKLSTLHENVHNDQLNFNKVNAVFKKVNVCSRQLKLSNTSIPVSFLSSCTTLVTDAISGIASFTEAINVDFYIQAFAEIMQHDMEKTKHFYNARSLYFEQYKNVEEVFRQYHPETLSIALNNISNLFPTQELWGDVKQNIEKDQISGIFDSVNNFINVNLNNGAVEKAYDTFQVYAEKNPAVLNACKSAGKVMWDLYETLEGKSRKLNIAEKTTSILLLQNEITELSVLHSKIENGENNQAKLESDIQEAIVGLQTEMEEIDYFLRKIYES